MAPPALYPRPAEARLLEALSDTPVVLVHGPRQCGKTTLAQHVGRKHGYAYFTFDDDAIRFSHLYRRGLAAGASGVPG